jgi:uridylate kinase
MYQRILLKLSGEALMGEKSFGIEVETVKRIAGEIKTIYEKAIQICLVVGGGNIFRGMSAGAQNMDRSTADQMGMLATVMNGLAIQSALEEIGISTRVMSGLSMSSVCEPYIRRRALRHLDKGRLIIFVGGTGNPYFTTDTAAALRASEMHCDVIMKATKVKGVYSADPVHHKEAILYKEIDYQQVLTEGLKVMDTAAIALARDNHIPIIVFSILTKGNLENVVNGEGTYTLIKHSVSPIKENIGKE